MNNYYDIANEDIEEAEDRYVAKKYNKCAVWCQQSSEKYLKYILVDKLGITGEGDTQKDKEDASIVNSHNLKRIYDRINEDDKVLSIPAATLFALTNYYVKARYPGEGYVDIDPETAGELIDHAKLVKKAADTFLESIPVEVHLQALANKYSKQ